MNTVALHGVTRITTQCKCINGEWHCEIFIEFNDGQSLSLVAHTDISREALEMIVVPDEYVRIEGGESVVERSAEPL